MGVDDSKELQNLLVDRIVREVLYRISAAEPKTLPANGTAVIVSSFVPSFDRVQESVRANFGTDDVYYFKCNDAEVSSKLERVTDVNEVGTEKVLSIISGMKNVVLLTPKIKLLENIAEGNDTEFVEFLITRSLLWEKNVCLLLDFEPPDFKRNTFYEKIVTSLQTLTDIGIKTITYRCRSEETGVLALVTETDVVAAFKAGLTEVRTVARALITPSAADKSKELGIEIN
ncbi:hypothetical protein AGMMS49983_18240 [Clostridia bacterium]|nr:hypothetical protein AGMMS49983_18240 [Clostridia bacterium]